MSDPPPEFLYRLQPTRPPMLTEELTPEESAAGATHVAYLERLAAADVVWLFGRTQTTDPSTFGVVIFRAAAPTEAQRIMAEDRAVRARVMRAELFRSASPAGARASRPAPDPGPAGPRLA